MPEQEYIRQLQAGKQPASNTMDNNPVEEDSIRSEEVTEIIGKMPHWIIRSGITIITVLCIIVFAGAYFFKYPDVIPAKVTITSGNPPVKLVARNSLAIQSIFVQNEEEVIKNQALCVFANAAKYKDVIQVAELVSVLDTSMDLRATIPEIVPPIHLQLGDLQTNYIELYQTIQAYNFFLRHNTYDAAIASLSNQIGYSSQLQSEQNNSQYLQQEQLRSS
jgi:hypothetical protein